MFFTGQISVDPSEITKIHKVEPNVLNSMGITNIIRLSHNNQDYYLDKKGDENDLDKALSEYNTRLENEKSKTFKTLSLVMEHPEDTFHYYFEIKINRSHKVGDYPIEIKVDGLINEFFEHLIDKSRLKHKMEHAFRSQDAYDFYVNPQGNHFWWCLIHHLLYMRFLYQLCKARSFEPRLVFYRIHFQLPSIDS